MRSQRVHKQLLAAHALASSVALRQGAPAGGPSLYSNQVPEKFQVPVEFASAGYNPPEASGTARLEQAMDHSRARPGGLLGLAGDWLESALVGELASHRSLHGSAGGGAQCERGCLNPSDNPRTPRWKSHCFPFCIIFR